MGAQNGTAALHSIAGVVVVDVDEEVVLELPRLDVKDVVDVTMVVGVDELAEELPIDDDRPLVEEPPVPDVDDACLLVDEPARPDVVEPNEPDVDEPFEPEVDVACPLVDETPEPPDVLEPFEPDVDVA